MAFKMNGWSAFTKETRMEGPKNKDTKTRVFKDYPRKSGGGINPSGSGSEEYIYTDDPRHPNYKK
tara:strand:- start:985 stop:1179 length:195 start_codon:yes stop_codon:yes gene_type:complete